MEIKKIKDIVKDRFEEHLHYIDLNQFNKNDILNLAEWAVEYTLNLYSEELVNKIQIIAEDIRTETIESKYTNE